MVQFSSLLAGALTRQISEDRKNNNSLSTLSFIKAVTICPGIVIMKGKNKRKERVPILHLYKPKSLLFDNRQKAPAPKHARGRYQ